MTKKILLKITDSGKYLGKFLEQCYDNFWETLEIMWEKNLACLFVLANLHLNTHFLQGTKQERCTTSIYNIYQSSLVV